MKWVSLVTHANTSPFTLPILFWEFWIHVGDCFSCILLFLHWFLLRLFFLLAVQLFCNFGKFFSLLCYFMSNFSFHKFKFLKNTFSTLISLLSLAYHMFICQIRNSKLNPNCFIFLSACHITKHHLNYTNIYLFSQVLIILLTKWRVCKWYLKNITYKLHARTICYVTVWGTLYSCATLDFF